MDTVTVVVEPGADLPQPGKLLAVNSPITGLQYDIKIKKIVSLRWHTGNGSLIVEVSGTKKLVAGGK